MNAKYALTLQTVAWGTLLVVATELSAAACGPNFPSPVFAARTHPDYPIEPYIRGRIGIIEPGYDFSYLLIAYRHLEGVSFPESTVLELKNYFEPGKRRFADYGQRQEDFEKWYAVRARALGLPEEVVDPRRPEPGNYHYAHWCPGEAFRWATEALTLRISGNSGHPPGSPEIKVWVANQDLAFSNCGKSAPIPPPVPSPGPSIASVPAADLPSAFEKDRDYREAANEFRSRNFAEAASHFEKIGDDEASPWRKLGTYLALRSRSEEILAGSKLPGADEKPVRSLLKRLEEAQLRPELSEFTTAFRHLSDRLALTWFPGEKLLQLSAILTSSEHQLEFIQSLKDFDWALRHPKPALPGASEGAELALAGGLGSWIQAFRSLDPRDFEPAYRRWKEHPSNSGLIASLRLAGFAKKAPADLIEAAHQVPADSPAYGSARYYALQLTPDTALREINEVLARPGETFSRRDRYLLLALKGRLAVDLQQFIETIPRPALLFTGVEDTLDPSIDLNQGFRKRVGALDFIDSTTADLLNRRFPLPRLLELAHVSSIPGYLRKEIAAIGATRSLILDRPGEGIEFLKILALVAPELKSSFPATLPSSKKPGEARHELLRIVLTNPGMGPLYGFGPTRTGTLQRVDAYADLSERNFYGYNHWCHWNPERSRTEPAPGFLSPAELQSASEEETALEASGTGAEFLLRSSIQWAENPDAAHDPKLPEVLSHAILSAKNCYSQEGSALSAKAFRILHGRFASSEWARKTPIHY